MSLYITSTSLPHFPPLFLSYLCLTFPHSFLLLVLLFSSLFLSFETNFLNFLSLSLYLFIYFFSLLLHLCSPHPFPICLAYFRPVLLPCSSISSFLCSPPLSVPSCSPISGVQLFKPHTYSSHGAAFKTPKKRGNWRAD